MLIALPVIYFSAILNHWCNLVCTKKFICYVLELKKIVFGQVIVNEKSCVDQHNVVLCFCFVRAQHYTAHMILDSKYTILFLFNPDT